MGCSSSKEPEVVTKNSPKEQSSTLQSKQPQKQRSPSSRSPVNNSNNSNNDDVSAISATIHANKPERLYKLLVKAHSCSSHEQTYQERQMYLRQALEHVQQEPSAASFCNPTTQSTPLHLACRLLDSEGTTSNPSGGNNTIESTLFQIIRTLIAVHRESLARVDAGGNLPLHYAIAPTTHFQNSNNNPSDEKKEEKAPATGGSSSHRFNWKQRAAVVRHLIDSDYATAQQYLSRSNIVYESGDASGPCTPLYRVLQVIPDDMDPLGPTVEYVRTVHRAHPSHAGMGNMADGDKPLGLLYRRFTRQFDISEKFFAGDNSRPMVVQHRRQYKTAAGNTWKCIEVLLKTSPGPGASIASHKSQESQENSTQQGIVHCAVQVETPPDLLRYIVETNAQDLTRVDGQGNLPLHYASKTKIQQTQPRASFPPFYTKYVIDELLYKFPEGASMPDGDSQFPLSLAVHAGKPWIGGGIKSLYNAYPDALQQLDLATHPALKKALSMQDNDDDDDDDEMEGIALLTPQSQAGSGERAPPGVVKDEDYDAIMLVQSQDVDVSEVVMSMWAHEEDAGVQMLGCVAIARMANRCLQQQKKQSSDKKNNYYSDDGVQLLALTSVAAVVNAMKAHPNEMIVQEKACLALKSMSSADGHREVSMVASGAVAAMIGAMQAHVGDASVQEHACSAVASIVKLGGPDRATVVGSVSGVTAIVNALAAHPSSEGVQHAGCQVLLAMMEYQERANLPDLPRTEAEPLLRSAMKQFPDSCGKMAQKLLDGMSGGGDGDDDDFPEPMPSPSAAAI